MNIRPAQPQDLSALIELCELHAIYEEADYDRNGKAEALKKHLFSDNPTLFCVVVEQENELIGYCSYMKQFSTWDAGFYVYMDCLFLKEGTRSQGIGAQLIAHVKKEARSLGCDLIQWQTPDFNTRAIKFYDREGATRKTKERCYLQA
ncbi:GNAT family N-acetyltransferase [Sanyastnella coralliicola]|uniref:GNAT family N-acetyltransferase n=1 Tax=Sanyastnella coralliicola TaxID=3069118 RepID=UPI0027BACCAA|nr:GNAT family N-acetyltransferase [Longitalea sp. SCSIO 12813]